MADEAVSLDKQIEDAERLLNETKEVVKEEVKEEVKEPVTPEVTEEAKEEPVEEKEELVPHGERSRLGRKVKRIEDTLTELKSTLDFIKERTATPKVVEEEEMELSEVPTAEEIKEYTKKEREKTLRIIEARETERKKKDTETQQLYAKEYGRLVEETLDPDEDADIFKMMTDTKDLTYNQVIKGDPKEDFLLNYRAATKAVLNKAKTTTKKTVLGVTPPAKVNVPAAPAVAPKTIDRSKLSKEEADLSRMFSDEELAGMGIG